MNAEHGGPEMSGFPDGIVIPGGARLEVVCYPVAPNQSGYTLFEIFGDRL